MAIEIAISIFNKDRDRDRDLNFGDRAHALRIARVAAANGLAQELWIALPRKQK